MNWTRELTDLPSGCAELIESIEMIITAEILCGGRGHLITYQNNMFSMRIGNFPSMLLIPQNIGPHTPAQMKLKKPDLILIKDLKVFEEKLKELSIIVTKKENQRRTGYLNMSGSSHTVEEPHWELLFVNQSKFYDFYLLCKQQGLF
jgi:hypothetical protein